MKKLFDKFKLTRIGKFFIVLGWVVLIVGAIWSFCGFVLSMVHVFKKKPTDSK